MADINQILGRNISSVKELKAAIKELQDSLVGVDAESEQFKTTSEQLSAAQEELVKVTKAGTQENNAAKDSIIGMKQEYKALYDQYKLLSDEQRNSDFGKNMAASLETLSSKINDTQKGVGSFKDNIGNYAGSISDAFNKMGVSVGALKGPLDTAKMASGGLNTAFKTLAANPIMLAITAIVAILVKAAAAIKNNEELTQRLHQAMSVFKPVLDAVSNAFDFLAGIIVKVIEGFAKFSAKVLSIIPGMKQAIKSHQDLAKATDELTKKQRENEVVNSQKQADIERLREEASATDDVIEKQRLLEEAKAKQAEVDQANIEIAQEELRILQEYGEKTANSAEENEKLAAAQKKVNDAIAQGERNQRMYNKQLDATTNKTKAAGSAGKSRWEEEREELDKFNKEYEKSLKTREQQTNDYYDDLIAKAKKHKQDTTNIEAARVRDLSVITQTAQQEELNREKRHRDNLSQLRNDAIGDAAADLGELQVNLQGIGNLFDLISKTYSEKGLTELAEVFKVLKESGDWSKLSDLSYVLGLFPQFEGNLKNIRDIWPELVAPIEELIQRVQTLFGVTVENAQDLQDQLALIAPKTTDVLDQAIEKQGIEAAKRIAETMREVNMAMTDADLEALNSDDMFKKIAENNFIRLSMERDALETELDDFKGTREQKLELMQQYYSVMEEMRANELALVELDAQRTREILESSLDFGDTFESMLGNIENLMKAEIDSGKLSEKEAERKKKSLEKLQKVQYAVAIANILANAAVGAMDIYKSYTAELALNAETAAATGPAAAATKAALDAKSLASAIIRGASLAATATAQLAAAKGGYISKISGGSDEGGGSTGVAASPMLIDSTPYSYTRTVQTAEEEDAINNRPLWVSVVDIENALGHQAEVKDESSF